MSEPADDRPCECTIAGYCERWGRQMSGRAHFLCQTRADYRELWSRPASADRPTPVQRRPLTLVDLAANATRDLLRWAAEGLPTVRLETLEARVATCHACDAWTGGRCSECGCTSLKLHRPASTCPADPPRWGPEAPLEDPGPNPVVEPLEPL